MSSRRVLGGVCGASLGLLGAGYAGCSSSSSGGTALDLDAAHGNAGDTGSTGSDADAAAGAGSDGGGDAATTDGAPDASFADADDGGLAVDGSGDAGPGERGLDAGPLDGAPPDGAALDGSDSATDSGLVDTATLTMDAFTVASNSETYTCQTFANPFGRQVDVVSMVSTMNGPSSDFVAFNIASTGAAVTSGAAQPCTAGGLERHPFLFRSQQGSFSEVYPQANMGYPLPAANGVMLYAHYVNSGAQPVHPSVTFTLKAAAPGIVTIHVGHIVLNDVALSVPMTAKTSPVTVAMSWTPSPAQFPTGYSIFRSWGRMHQYGLDLQASTSGTAFYDQTAWSEPPSLAHMPPLAMTVSQTITVSCKYYNPTSATMHFGGSAITDDQCIYMAEYYSSGASNPDILLP